MNNVGFVHFFFERYYCYHFCDNIFTRSYYSSTLLNFLLVMMYKPEVGDTISFPEGTYRVLPVVREYIDTVKCVGCSKIMNKILKTPRVNNSWMCVDCVKKDLDYGKTYCPYGVLNKMTCDDSFCGSEPPHGKVCLKMVCPPHVWRYFESWDYSHGDFEAVRFCVSECVLCWYKIHSPWNMATRENQKKAQENYEPTLFD